LLVLAVAAASHAQADDKPAAGTSAKPDNIKLKDKQMSASEQLGVARGVVARGQDLAQRLMHMVDEARREGDVIRLTCLNDKLTQANANVTTAQSRLEGLQHAVDVEGRAHEFTVIVVIGMKIQTLDQEANQCVGQDLYETGATKIQTTVDYSMLPFENTSSNAPVLVPPSVPSIPPRASGVK
jgi:hypothetical protein